MPRGKFIVFEGMDGSGKTTNAKALVQHLVATNSKLSGWESATLVEEPTRTLPFGQYIRGILAGHYPLLPPLTMAGLFAADREQHIRTVIRPLLESNIDVVCDRYIWSTIAYNTGELDEFLAQAHTIVDMHQGFYLSPDAVFYLIIDVDTALQRLKDRAHLEIYESRNTLHRVHRKYDLMFGQSAYRFRIFQEYADDLGKPAVYAIDAARPLQEVQDNILRIVATL